MQGREFDLVRLLNIDELISAYGFDLFANEGMRELRLIECVQALSVQASAKPPDDEQLMYLRQRRMYWTAFKAEFVTLLCTRDRKYQTLRRSFTKHRGEAQTAVVAGIAAVIGAKIGVAPGVITPFAVLCLIALAKVGKEAFCRTTDLDDIKPFAD